MMKQPKQRHIGQKPFSFRGLSLAATAGVLAVTAVYAAFGDLSPARFAALCLAAGFMVAFSLFLDRTWASVRRFVILGSPTIKTKSDDEETEAAAEPRAGGSGYAGAAIRATILPIGAALLVGLLTGELAVLLVFGVCLSLLTNLLVLLLWRTRTRSR